MTCSQMPRRRRTFSIDEPIIDALETLQRDSRFKNLSMYVEGLLAAHAIAKNVLGADYVLPGETRGGDRTVTKTEEGAE